MRRWWWAVSCALAPSACILGTDGLTGGGTPPPTSPDADATVMTADAGDARESDANVAADAGLCDDDATFCDDFERTTPLADSAPWAIANCAAPGALTVNGALVTTRSGGSGFAECALESLHTTTAGSHFTIDFDMTFTPIAQDASTAVVVVSLNFGLATANAKNQDGEGFQLAVNGTGGAEIGAVFHYPFASMSPQTGVEYPYYRHVSANPFVTLSTPCHISFEVDSLTPAVPRATATCGAKTFTMTLDEPDRGPAGFAAPLFVTLGYAYVPHDSAPSTSITYDNLVFRQLE